MSEIARSRILITGGASGIGRLMALGMAAKGGKVAVWDMSKENLDGLRQEAAAAGREIVCARVDVSDRRQVYQAAAELVTKMGGLDILVNNAGIVNGKPFLECSDEAVERTLKVNTMALFWTVKAFLPGMISRGRGHLVTIASAGGIIGTAGLADYSASKFAAFGFDEALRMEFKKQRQKIKTTVVCPFFIDTGMFEGVKTRFAFLLPILKQGRSAARIIKAIEKDRPRLWMPPIVYTVPLLRILPVGMMDFVARLLGVSNTMDEFVGREPEKKGGCS